MARQSTLFWVGYSESLWKSTVVKSIRMGWPDGLIEAAKHLNKSTMKALLMCGVFEDVWPTLDELPAVVREVDARDYVALCERQTLHGRGYAQQLFDMREEAVKAAEEQRNEIWREAHKMDLSLPPRALNCFYTWVRVNPMRSGVRTIDPTRWTTMPLAMADGHTLEGKREGRKMTVLSGHYPNHLALGERVMREGWKNIRQEVHQHLFEERE